MLKHAHGVETSVIVKPPVGARVSRSSTDENLIDPSLLVGMSETGGGGGAQQRAALRASKGLEIEEDIDRLMRQRSAVGFQRRTVFRGLRVKVSRDDVQSLP